MPLTAGTPPWYSGSGGILKALLERAWGESHTPQQPFSHTHPIFSHETPFQQAARNRSWAEINNPAYQKMFNQAEKNISDVGQSNVTNQIQPYLTKGTENPTLNAEQYMNPFQQKVIENIGKMGSRNLLENILPKIKDKFISGGSYGSTGHLNLTTKAIRDTQEAIADAQAKALESGYNKALDTSVNQQGRNLQTGSLLSQNLGEDLSRKMEAGKALPNLANVQLGHKITGIQNLNELGKEQQQVEQARIKALRDNYNEIQNYPHEQTARVSNIIQGHQPHPSYTSYTPNLPGPSPFSTGAGLLTTMYGASMQPRSYSKGGQVKKYEVGGLVDNNMPHQMNPMALTEQPQMMPNNFPNMSPQMFPQPQGSGLLSGMYGSPPNPQSYAHGGHVKSVKHIRHYAEGGSTLHPIQQGSNYAMDASAINHERKNAQNPATNNGGIMQNPYYSPEEFEGISDLRELAQRMKRPQINPLGMALMKSGLAIAGRKHAGNFWQDVAGAGQQGIDEYQKNVTNEEERYRKGVDVQKMIGDTHRKMEESRRAQQLDQLKHKENHELAKLREEHEHARGTKSLGFEEERLGFERQKLPYELANKKIYETKTGDVFKVSPEGDLTAMPGIKNESNKRDTERDKKIAQYEAKRDVEEDQVEKDSSKAITLELEELKKAKDLATKGGTGWAAGAKEFFGNIIGTENAANLKELEKTLEKISLYDVKGIAGRVLKEEFSTIKKSLPSIYTNVKSFNQVMDSMIRIKEYEKNVNDFNQKWRKNHDFNLKGADEKGRDYDQAFLQDITSKLSPKLVKEMKEKKTNGMSDEDLSAGLNSLS